MMKKTLLLSIILTLVATTSWAKTLHYTIDARHPETHQVHVTLDATGFGQSTVHFQMPIWAPGAYSVSHYGHYIRNLVASDRHGRSLHVVQDSNDRWTILGAKALATISYDVMDSHADSTSLFFGMANFDTSLVYANATALFGYVNDDKRASYTTRYQLPSGWQLLCALPPGKRGYSMDTSTTFRTTQFYASDYDVLVDAPVMAAPEIQGRSFREGSAVYQIGLVSQEPFAMDSLSAYLQKIVRAETDFFHQTPFRHYSFLIYAPTMSHVPTFLDGALEHANSSNYLLINVSWPLFKAQFLSTFSHEFFHLWDVKRIHSNLLGPFDYTKRVETTSLWMAEGVTEYYAHTLLTRYGIEPATSFYGSIASWQRLLDQLGSHIHLGSLEELSIAESAFDPNEAMMFYIKGPLVAWMLDVEIRRQTQNRSSLDQVMFALNRDAIQGKTFADSALIGLVERYSGAKLMDFYHHYIQGTDPLPIEKYLGYMGIENHGLQPSVRFEIATDTTVDVSYVEPGSSYAKAGFQAHDVVRSIDGVTITPSNSGKEVRKTNRDSVVTFEVIRDGKQLQLVVHHDADERQSWDYKPYAKNPKSTPLENAIRRGVTGSI